MNLPIYSVRERTAQEIQDMVDRFMNVREISADTMELILYKVLSHVQTLKAYEYANIRIRESEIQEQEEQQKMKEGDTGE